MSTPDNQSSLAVQPPTWPDLLKRLAIWGLFLGFIYLIRDFFFLAFMTFIFSYVTLAVVGRAMRWLSPDRERPGLRRLLTIGVFVLTPMILFDVGSLVVPRLIAQGQRLAGWLSQVDPETEVARFLERFVGPSEFRRQYGIAGDPRYQKALEKFRKDGPSHVTAYNDFPQLEGWIQGGFSKQFDEDERGRISRRLAAEGTSSREFEQWFFTEKFPELQDQARKLLPQKGRATTPTDPLVRLAATAKPEELLQQLRHNPAALAAMRQDWLHDAIEPGLASARSTPTYQKQFKEYYNQRLEDSPASMPYTYDQFVELQRVRPQGRRAFGEALEKMQPSADGDGETRLQADFKAAKEHELFQDWWSTSTTARFVRRHVESGGSGGGLVDRVEKALASFLNVPLDIGTALLLSFFICIDFPRLRSSLQRLRETWLRDAYNEIAPALSSLAELVGLSMQAQGLIALCNATMLYIAMKFLGVEHEVVLSLCVFVLCLVPTLGAIIAWALIAVVALVQPGGGIPLALKASVAVVFVLFMESFVLSPRILGRMMELHPVLVIAILPVAQYFFGVWGLILAIPVAVYVIHVIILDRGLPRGDAHEPVQDKPRVAESR